MIKEKKLWDHWKEADGTIEIIKEKNKEHTSQFYTGEPAVILTMITSMAHTLIARKAFTKEELLRAIEIGATQDELE